MRIIRRDAKLSSRLTHWTPKGMSDQGESSMAQKSARLPTRFPIGSTYVVEARGSVQGMTLMHRYVRFPDGRRVELTARLVPASPTSAAITVRPDKRPVNRSRARAAADATG
jgi:hypothetical protein